MTTTGRFPRFFRKTLMPSLRLQPGQLYPRDSLPPPRPGLQAATVDLFAGTHAEGIASTARRTRVLETDQFGSRRVAATHLFPTLLSTPEHADVAS